MIINRLTLDYFCQHRQRDLTFSPRLNLLIGPNGSGKSNILRAMQFALTGDAGGDRNKLDDIAQAAGPADPAGVGLWLTHAGTPMEISRRLRPNSNIMQIGNRQWTGVTELNKELWLRLGTTKKQLADYVFVGQRKIDEMFDQKPADRASSLAALFGLSHAAAIHKQTGDFINAIEVPMSLVDADKLRQRQQELQVEEQRLVAQSLALIAKRDADCASIDLDIACVQEDIANSANFYAEARGALQQWKLYHASKKVRDQAGSALKAAQAALTEVPAPPTEPELSVDDLAARDSYAQQIANKNEAIRHLKSTNFEKCSACGQQMPNYKDRLAQIAKLEHEVMALGPKLSALNARYHVWARYDEDFKAYYNQLNNVEKAQAAVDGLKSCAAPDVDENRLNLIVAEEEDSNQCLAELRTRRANVVREAAAATDRINVLQLARIASEREHIVQQLRDFERVAVQSTLTRDAKEHLAAVRQVFHHDESPRMVSYTYIESMLEDINTTLEIFDAPYRVVMDENLGFVANFLDGIRRQPDRRLSVGERIVLAMAFRITVNATFASQIGVLVMDEPTAGLDEHNIGCLPHALDRLKELSEERDLQVFFVTHEQRIASQFDNVIQLQAASI